MALNTSNLNTILNENCVTKRYFIGTFPSCTIGRLPRKKAFAFITNTDHHNNSGTHWNAWFARDGTVYFFDSFGRSPLHETFPHDYRDILLKFDTFKYFNGQIQSVDSFCCGYFCIHFILNLCLGLDMQSFSRDYFKDTNKNDLIVMNIIKSLL